MDSILTRLLMQATTVYGISIPAISKGTGITCSTLYDWKNGGQPKDYKLADKVCSYLEQEIGRKLDTEDLLSLERPRTEFLIPTQIRVCLNRERVKLPVFAGASLQAGAIRKIENDIDLFVDYVYAHAFGKIDGAVFVTTDSLYKTFEPRCKILIKRLPFPQMLHQGYPYFFIDINGEPFLRRVRKGKNSSSVILYSENSSKHPDQEWKKHLFMAVFEIRGILKQMPYNKLTYVD